MKIEPLDINHRDLLRDRLRAVDTGLSEYSFANLFLFRKNHEYEVIHDKEIFITGITYDGLRFIMPTVDARNIDPVYLSGMIRDFGTLFPVPEEWLEIFDSERYNISYDDGDTDYVYMIEKIGSYRGRHLHKKRNLLKQFLSMYNHTEHRIKTENIPDLRDILEHWQKESDFSKEDTDYSSCMEAIELFNELELCGGIYYVDDEPAGFILSEEIHDKVVALHFAKGKRKFKGIYQYMYNSFAKIMPEKYCCFNFEQDLGNSSLRQAKSSYRPDHLLKKYRVGVLS